VHDDTSSDGPIAREPEFRLTIGRRSHYDVNLRQMTYPAYVSLTALGLRPVPRGTYTLDGDPAALLAALASEIERADFFTMHFTTTNPQPFVWLTFSDANGRRFFALIDRIGAIVSAP
jgi:hypothetical protein